MACHLVKLCVGAHSVEDLKAWIDFRLDSARSAGRKPEQFHTTRMYPKRAEEIIGQGSLFWVIKGVIQCRQKVIDIRRFVDDDGIGRCNIVLHPELILTRHHPKRPFQGWRYLSETDAPEDLPADQNGEEAMPEHLRSQLSELGLL